MARDAGHVLHGGERDRGDREAEVRSLRSTMVVVLMLCAFGLATFSGCGGGASQAPGSAPGSAPADGPGATTGTAPAAGGAKPRLLLFTQPG